MIIQMKSKTTKTSRQVINSPRKSDHGSIKSTSSINKKTGANKSNKNIPQRNSTIYDSDT